MPLIFMLPLLSLISFWVAGRLSGIARIPFVVIGAAASVLLVMYVAALMLWQLPD